MIYYTSCATEILSGEDNNDNLAGGYFKPHRSDQGGAPSDQDFFPILLVFVQFYSDPVDQSNSFWPVGQAPNYMGDMIINERQSGSNWWNSYNGYDVSDYWHETSRGKLHAIGNAYSVILPQTEAWYLQNYPNNSQDNPPHTARLKKINKDIYERLKLQISGSDWLFYDKWTSSGTNNFTWGDDGKLDMMYVVFRSNQEGTLRHNAEGWVPLFSAESEVTNEGYPVYTDGSYTLHVNGSHSVNGSGLYVTGRGGPCTRELFLEVMSHEHGHYLFGGDHVTYSKMAYGSGREFSLSPWEMVKLDYIVPRSVNYSNPVHVLGDYSSRGGTAGTTGEVIEIPGTGNELFLLANRRKVSDWDRRMSGDTLADDPKNYLNPNVNPEYGKGLYIYHIQNGYTYSSSNKMDMECADGLWNWEQIGHSSPSWSQTVLHPVFKKSIPSYDNDFTSGASCNNKDGMSVFCPGSSYNPNTMQWSTNNSQSWYGIGKEHTYSPFTSGTDRMYTNDESYWYNLEFFGDRWDAWNVGYNEIFSPWSSPNTKDQNNNQTGIYVWYKSLNTSTNEATLEIYKIGQNGETESSILLKTPPSRPMGLKVGEYYPGGAVCHPKVEWVHNMEPDMIRNAGGGFGSQVKRYKIYRSTTNTMSSVPYSYTHIATVDIDPNTSPSYIDYTINKFTCESLEGDPNAVPYPVRYKIKAIDEYDDESVYSDFASTVGILDDGTGKEEEGGDNITITGSELPTVFSLNQNYPNPFNPTTNIQFDIPTPEFVTLKIYDISGKEVATLVNEHRNAGSFIIGFNASSFASGVYFYKIKAGNFEQTRRMVLVK